jgi:Bardet-Biedl syndrome 5 protein
MSKVQFLHVDRDIKFDTKGKYFDLQAGEEEIDLISKVEDTKGKTGEKGEMRVTNLRLMWISSQKADTNLSTFNAFVIFLFFFEGLGLNCVKDLFIRNANSVIKGSTQV